MAGKGKSTIETSNAFVDESYSQQNADVRIGQHVQISVSDIGCGMSREVQEKHSTRSSRPRSPGGA
jgi:signal transduction histidine kinase